MSVPQYHPGKVMDTYSAGDSGVIAGALGIQAMVRMWDGHTLVVNVDQKLGGKLKTGDVVLVDYYPSEKFETPLPRMAVAKILRGDKARKIVDEYKDYKTRMSRTKRQPPEKAHSRYIG